MDLTGRMKWALASAYKRDLERAKRPRAEVWRKKMRRTLRQQGRGAACGGGCCIGRHAVGRSEAAKRKAPSIEDVETRGEERKRGYGCKAWRNEECLKNNTLQIIYSDYFCALHFDINICIIHDDHTHKICHTLSLSLSLSFTHTHIRHTHTHTHTNLNTNYVYIQIRLNIDFLGEGNATIKQSLLTNCWLKRDGMQVWKDSILKLKRKEKDAVALSKSA